MSDIDDLLLREYDEPIEESETYPYELDAVDMAEFTKGRSYTTGWYTNEVPYVMITTGRHTAGVVYRWHVYDQVYRLEDTALS